MLNLTDQTLGSDSSNNNTNNTVQPTNNSSNSTRSTANNNSPGSEKKPLIEKRHISNNDDDVGALEEEHTEPPTIIQRFIIRPIVYIVDTVTEFSYIFFLMSYTLIVCFVFAVILFLLEPPGTTTVIQTTNFSDNSTISEEVTVRLSFVQACFMSLGAFSGTGLAPVDYSRWKPHVFALLAVIVTFGSYVLLTVLPAVIRYRALVKERTKLIHILGLTGAYDTDKESVFNPQLDSRKIATKLLNYNNDNNTNPTASPISSMQAIDGSSTSPPTVSSPTTSQNQEGSEIPNKEKERTPSQLNEKERQERDEALKIAQQLTFGKRIVYEDGLAHINQQIDICLIIIANVIFYWSFLHILFTLLCMAGGKSFGWSLFHVITGFNNAGLAFSASSMIPIAGSPWLLFVLSLAMVMGNPLYPVFFRFQISLLHRLMRAITSYNNKKYAMSVVFGQPLIVWQHSVRLFLRYPRKYYTHMFAKKNTLNLFLLWFAVTLVGLLLFIPELHADRLFPPGANGWDKFWVFLFQSIAVRSTGFNDMDLNELYVAQVVWWLFAMYTSAYPFILTVRATRYNAEKDDELNPESPEPSTAKDLRREATGVLSRDLFWLYCAVMIICFGEKIELSSSEDNNLFLRICFEITSAFGNVGLSLSLPDTNYSFAGSLSTLSIWVLIIVMYCGKHRNLPHSLDDAIAIRVRQYDFSTAPKELDPDFRASFAALGKSVAISDAATTGSSTRKIKRVGGGGGTAVSISSQPQASYVVDNTNTSMMDNDSNRGEDDQDGNVMKERVAAESLVASNDDVLLRDQNKLFASSSFTVLPKLQRKKDDLFLSARTTRREKKKNNNNNNDEDDDTSEQQQDENQNNNNLATENSSSACRFQASVSVGFIEPVIVVNELGQVVHLTPSEIFERRVRNFYEHYNPARLPQVERIIKAFEHNPKALLRNLATTYGAEPPLVQQQQK